MQKIQDFAVQNQSWDCIRLHFVLPALNFSSSNLLLSLETSAQWAPVQRECSSTLHKCFVEWLLSTLQVNNKFKANLMFHKPLLDFVENFFENWNFLWLCHPQKFHCKSFEKSPGKTQKTINNTSCNSF